MSEPLRRVSILLFALVIFSFGLLAGGAIAMSASPGAPASSSSGLGDGVSTLDVGNEHDRFAVDENDTDEDDGEENDTDETNGEDNETDTNDADEDFEDQQNATIQSINLSGDGYNETQYEIVYDHPGDPYVWQDGALNVTAEVEANDASGSYQLCGRVIDGENGDGIGEFDCDSFSISSGESTNATVHLSNWPDNATGNHTIVLELSKSGPGSDDAVYESTIDVIVIERDSDFTGDGLTNEQEFALGTDFTRPDTIGNGLTDWEEAVKYGTDPLKADTTGDGINDATLVRIGIDPTEPYLLHQYVAGFLFVLASLGFAAGVLKRRRPSSPQHDDPEPMMPMSTDGAAEAGNAQGDGFSIDESIMTNEEIVQQLLRKHGGRMKQTQIVESTDWSKAKVSRVLTKLEDRDVVKRIRIGREKVVDLEAPPEQADEAQ